MMSDSDGSTNRDSRGTTVAGGVKSPILRLPVDVMHVILSFIPAPHTICSVSGVASHFSRIVQSEEYWQNVWATYLNSCYRRYVQHAAPSLHAVVSTSHAAYTLPLASVPKTGVSRLDWIGSGGVGGGGLTLMEEFCNTGDDDSVMHYCLMVEPLRLHCAHKESVVALEGCLSQRRAVRETRGVSRTYKRDDPQGIRKAMYFLHSGGTLAHSRPMVDGLHVVRVVVFSHRLPPPYHRVGTSLEQEAALVEFLGALTYAWSRCHPAYCTVPLTTAAARIPVDSLETVSTSIFPPSDDISNASEGDGGVATGSTNDGVFFSVTTQPYMSTPSSVSSLSPAAGRKVSAVPPGTMEEDFPLHHSLADTVTYLYLLHHVTFSDIHEHICDDERRCAICSRVVSPTGHAVEFRFFVSSLQSSYPRFFLKMFFVEGDLPRTRIQEVFDHENALSTTTAATSSTGVNSEDEDGDDAVQQALPKLTTLFYGGFGRVEVDIPPTVLRDHFEKLSAALGLAERFPMPLLWNVVMFASGVGGVILQEQLSSFMAYYTTSFAAAFEKLFT